jgi:hypothetical protein
MQVTLQLYLVHCLSRLCVTDTQTSFDLARHFIERKHYIS